MPPIQERWQLTHNEGVQILVFWQLGMTYEAIAKMFHNVSLYQVEYVIHKSHSTSRYFWSSLSQEFISYLYSKCSGRPSFIMNEQLQELTVFVCAFSHNHHLFWAQLPFKYPMCTWENATEWTIFSVMKHSGFHRWIAWIKPSISEKNRLLWLVFTREHLNWT